MSVLLITDDRFDLHDQGAGHPESIARLKSIRRLLATDPVQGANWTPARDATQEEIARVHDPEYLRELDRLRGHSARLDPDTAISPGSVDAAIRGAGAVVTAVEAVMQGASSRAFALVRPPGHHARPRQAMGFCLLNNVAVAAAHARAALGLKRVLVVDWDVHHGNGTQEMFYGRDDILFFSTHQMPLYPGTGALEEVGAGAGEGFTVNVPLPPGAGDADLAGALAHILVPIANAWHPELVIVSAGFDAHRLDPLAQLNASEAGFVTLCRRAVEIANRHAEGRIVLALEGGYHLEALSKSVRACVEVLADVSPRATEPAPPPTAAILEACEFHRKHWPLPAAKS